MGTVMGRLAIKAGYPVLMASSKPVEDIALTVEILVPKAKGKTNQDLIKEADVLILALPLSKVKQIPTQNLHKKIIIDATNYWPEIDGLKRIPNDPEISSSQYVATLLPNNYLVKAFNHMGYHDLEYETFSEELKVIAYAGEDEKAKLLVKQFILDLGFDALDLGNLEKGRVLEPGSSLFGANLNRTDFNQRLKELQSDES